MERPTTETPLTNFWLTEGRLRTVWRLGAFGGVFIACTVVLVLVVSQVFGASGKAIALNQIVMLGATLVATWFGVVMIDRKKFLTVGLYLRRNWLRQLTAGIAIASAMMALILFIEIAFGIVEVQGVQPTIEHGVFTFLQGLYLYVLVGFAEEILLRGYPLQTLIEGTNKGVALILTSALFSALHIGNPNLTAISMANIFLAGVWLGSAYLVSGSLWAPIGMHIGWNFMQGTILGFPVSGIVDRGLLLSLEQGDDWLTGGAFGPEGGLLATLILIAGTAVLYHPLVAGRLRSNAAGSLVEGVEENV